MIEKKLFLLDAYALIFRAYYALIKMPRVTQSGFNTSAIFGFVNTLEEILRKERPSHIAVCFDPPGPTFRDEAFEQYKGERAATPEDIKLSVPYIKDILRAYNIKVIEVAGFEADDVIGTLAVRAAKEGYTVYMMTPDKDFGQLVAPQILQYKPSHRGSDFEIRGEKEVCERYGLERTAQVIDLLALMGDKVDNIPGCPGVGEKTAIKWIQEYGSVENLLDHTADIKGKMREKVEQNREQILFSKFLATIRTDAPIDESIDNLRLHEPQSDQLFAIFRQLEFKTLIDRIGRRLGVGSEGKRVAQDDREENKGKVERKKVLKQDAKIGAPSLFGDEDFAVEGELTEQSSELPRLSLLPEDMHYFIVESSEALRELNEALAQAEVIGVNVVADGDNDMSAQLRGVAISTAPGRGWWIPAANAEGIAFWLDQMARVDLQKISANSKRDYVIAARLRKDTVTPLQNYYDVALAHYLLQPEMRHRIEDLASSYLNYDMQRGLSAEQSACEIADVVMQLKKPFSEALKRENLETLYRDMELPLVEVLADMELTGVALDVEALNTAASEMLVRIETLENEVCEMAGERFNVGSPAKVGEILFDKLKLDEKAKKTKTGQYSTSEDVLEKLTGRHPIVAKILEFRALRKLYSTYLVALPEAINPATGRVHTNYNQIVTATGRLSSTAPNLQNIPVRDDEGREIRRAFIPSPGNIFLSADYSQIELRLVADFAADETMLMAFAEGEDIHAITAAKIAHKEPADVTAAERRNAKTANFGILYGISAFGLSQRLGISRAEAKELIDGYFRSFPAVHHYMLESAEKAREQGYVETRFGRKRMLPDINSRNPVVRGYAERNAINAPIQGSAADIMKRAMITIWREMRRREMRSRMIMQVHDELNFDVVPEELEALREIVVAGMEEAYKGAVRLTASVGVGPNWLAAH